MFTYTMLGRAMEILRISGNVVGVFVLEFSLFDLTCFMGGCAPGDNFFFLVTF